MAEIGQRRSEEGTWAFVTAWPLLGAGLYLGLGMGLLWCGVIGASLAGGFSRLFVRWRNERIIETVAAKHGLPREFLDARHYLID